MAKPSPKEESRIRSVLRLAGRAGARTRLDGAAPASEFEHGPFRHGRGRCTPLMHVEREESPHRRARRFLDRHSSRMQKPRRARLRDRHPRSASAIPAPSRPTASSAPSPAQPSNSAGQSADVTTPIASPVPRAQGSDKRPYPSDQRVRRSPRGGRARHSVRRAARCAERPAALSTPHRTRSSSPQQQPSRSSTETTVSRRASTARPKARACRSSSCAVRANPSLSTRDLWEMVQDLKDRGVRRIEGDILVDQHFFDETFVPPAFDQQPNEWATFRAPVSALALNENTVTMTVRPTVDRRARAGHLRSAGFRRRRRRREDRGRGPRRNRSTRARPERYADGGSHRRFHRRPRSTGEFRTAGRTTRRCSPVSLFEPCWSRPGLPSVAR